MTTAETNKAVVRSFLEGIWNHEKLAALEPFLAPDLVIHDALGDTTGLGAFREEVRDELEAFADVLVTIDDLVADGDRVAVRYTSSYMHHGEFMHAWPTGRLEVVRSMAIHRLVDGKIVEIWEAYDRRTSARDHGAEQRLTEADEAAIQSSIEIARRIGITDIEALVQHYWGEWAEVVTANGEVFRGRKAIATWLQRFPAGLEWRLFDVSIDGAGEFAGVRGRYAIELAGRHVQVDSGHYLEFWRKQTDGSWKVMRHVYTSQFANASTQRDAAAPYAQV